MLKRQLTISETKDKHRLYIDRHKYWPAIEMAIVTNKPFIYCQESKLKKLVIENREWIDFFAVSFLVFFAALPSLLFAGNGVLPEVWLREDGIYESVAVIACIVTALALFRFGIKHCKSNKLLLFWVMSFSLSLFFLGGEEMSWGQRLIGFDIPENMANLNYQNEFNLHNSTLIQSYNNMLSIYLTKLLVLYLVIFPIFVHAFPTADKIFTYIKIPTPILSIALTALVAQLISTQTFRFIYGSTEGADSLSVGEAFESILELCLCWVAWNYMYLVARNSTK